MGLLDMFTGRKEDKCVVHQEVQCPNCKAKFEIREDVERCPSCGVHVDLILTKKCPNCETRNGIFAVKCARCGYDFCAEKYRAESEKKKKYKCPYCEYKADYMFDVCPLCSTKIYWAGGPNLD